MIQPRGGYLFRAPSPEQKDRRRSTIRSSSPKSAPSPPSSRRPSSTPLPEQPKTQPEVRKVQPKLQPAPVVERTVSEPVSIPTAPMLVQPRFHPSARGRDAREQAQTVKSRGQFGSRAGRKLSEKHDPNSLPPAVAALLAVTSIPPPSRINRRRPSQQRRISIDELIQEWRQEDGLSTSEGYKSPLDVLLEPADETDNEDDRLLAGMDDEKDPALLSSRSVSSDSIASTTPSLAPSLDGAHSTVSNFSAPQTPSYRTRKPSAIRLEKVVSSPPAENCLDSHPLQTPTSNEPFSFPVQTFPPKPKRAVKQKSTFKSNLTASFSALKSAAKSFSNFTAPSIPQDDHITRSFFSQPYPPEMRPRDIDGVPDPALRRYLNPQHNTLPPLPPISSEDFSFQLQEALAQPTSDPDDSPLVQMQTFSRRKKSRSRSNVSVGPDRGEASVLGQSLPAIRQREPRENSDFLRVIVLEMNMRRTGKLDSKGPLRARIWLPPRRNGEGSEVEIRAGKEVPIRWVGLSPEDI